MAFTDPPDRAETIDFLAIWYDVDPKLFARFSPPTLERAWRVVQFHQPLAPAAAPAVR